LFIIIFNNSIEKAINWKWNKERLFKNPNLLIREIAQNYWYIW